MGKASSKKTVIILAAYKDMTLSRSSTPQECNIYITKNSVWAIINDNTRFPVRASVLTVCTAPFNGSIFHLIHPYIHIQRTVAFEVK